MPNKGWLDDHFLGLTKEEASKAKELREAYDKKKRRNESFWSFFKKTVAIIALASFIAIVLDYFSVIPIGIFHKNHLLIIENELTVQEETTVHRQIIVQDKPLATNSQIYQMSRLKNGIDLMSRDYNDAASQIAPWRNSFSIASSQLNQINAILNIGGMSAYQYNQAINQRNNIEADYDNSKIRIKELSDKMDSLQNRMRKANKDIADMMGKYIFP